MGECPMNNGGDHCFCGACKRYVSAGVREAVCCYCGSRAHEIEADEFPDDGSEENLDLELLPASSS